MKITRRTQLLVVALALCFTTMIGSTFAWFTDSVQTTENNVITAGNLDLEFNYTLNGEDWFPLEGASGLFKDTLWEPGHTEVIVLEIKNTGNLAAKYTANMNIVNETIGKTKGGEDIKLSDYLTLSSMSEGANPFSLAAAYAGKNYLHYSHTGKLEEKNVLAGGPDLWISAGTSIYMYIKVEMPTTVGNEANHNGKDIPSINLGLNVVATQAVYEHEDSKEYDSFGFDYDANAQYPTLTSTDDENEATE